MTRLIIDASVAVKWLLPEEGAIQAARLIELGEELAAPELIYPEVGNVLWKRSMRGELEGNEVTSLLELFWKAPLIIVPLSRELLLAASEIAVCWQRSFYDSIYLATAFLEQNTLITADLKLVNALNGTPIAPHLRSLYTL